MVPTKVISLHVIATLVFYSLVLSLCVTASDQNPEIDDLIVKFQNGLSTLAQKTGNQRLTLPGDVFTLEAAEQAMKELFANLERTVVEARQRAANMRSVESLEAIEKLRFI